MKLSETQDLKRSHVVKANLLLAELLVREGSIGGVLALVLPLLHKIIPFREESLCCQEVVADCWDLSFN